MLSDDDEQNIPFTQHNNGLVVFGNKFFYLILWIL